MKWWTSPAALVAIVLAGCGGASSTGTTTATKAAGHERTDVRRVLLHYYRAGLERDGAASCSLMSRQAVAIWSESSGGQSCTAAIDELFTSFSAKQMAEQRQTMRDLSRARVRIDENVATVVVPGEWARLVKEGGRWLVNNTHPANAADLTVFSAAQLELELKSRLHGKDGRPIQGAICPLNQHVVVGHSFKCVVEYRSGSRGVVTLEVRSPNGRYSVSSPIDLRG